MIEFLVMIFLLFIPLTTMLIIGGPFELKNARKFRLLVVVTATKMLGLLQHECC